jgi:hypothetical protein
MYGGREFSTGFGGEKDHIEDTGVDGRIML